jgi:hypothetical protein
MEMQSIDFTAIAAILVAGSLLMVPILGLTLRLVVPPIVESWARARAIRSAPYAATATHRTRRSEPARETRPSDEQAMERELVALHS